MTDFLRICKSMIRLSTQFEYPLNHGYFVEDEKMTQSTLRLDGISSSDQLNQFTKRVSMDTQRLRK